MDVNRRHLIGASAAGVAGAAGRAGDAARAAPLASSLGRTSRNSVCGRGSADDQTKALQKAIDEAGAQGAAGDCRPCLSYRHAASFERHATDRRARRHQTRLHRRSVDAVGRRRDSVTLTGITLDGGGVPLPARRGLIHCLAGRDVSHRDCEILAAAAARSGRKISGDVSGQYHQQHRGDSDRVFDAKGLIVSRTASQALATTHRDPAHIDRRRRYACRGQPHRGHQGGPGGSGQYGNAINAFRAGT